VAFGFGVDGVAWKSAAAMAMAPLQDLLNLGREARMNVPGRAEGNWRWRATEDMCSNAAFEWLRDLTNNSKRFTKQRNKFRNSELQTARNSG